jgi:hypothetical protein
MPVRKKPERNAPGFLPGTIRKELLFSFLLIQIIALVFLLAVTWLDEELIIPEILSKTTNLSPKFLAEITESVWIILLFAFTINFQMKSWKKIKLLEGILPICSYCKRIRDEKKAWTQMEEYISDHSEADFSHGLCPECVEKHFGEYSKMISEGG